MDRLCEQSQVLENALWTAIRVMCEQVALLRHLAEATTPEVSARHLENARETEAKALLIRNMLLTRG
ncbi:MAG: hypothetical protein JWM11_7075 [Planctomycetaceae bacterium]|nr:hypothetical protein [Planctomycetaceae bacterium]